jgi:hypothetical protein
MLKRPWSAFVYLMPLTPLRTLIIHSDSSILVDLFKKAPKHFFGI